MEILCSNVAVVINDLFLCMCTCVCICLVTTCSLCPTALVRPSPSEQAMCHWSALGFCEVLVLTWPSWCVLFCCEALTSRWPSSLVTSWRPKASSFYDLVYPPRSLLPVFSQLKLWSDICGCVFASNPAHLLWALLLFIQCWAGCSIMIAHPSTTKTSNTLAKLLLHYNSLTKVTLLCKVSSRQMHLATCYRQNCIQHQLPV